MSANRELLELLGPELRLLLPELDEKSRRLTLGAVARAAGDGGIGAVARVTGASWQTVAGGAAELASGQVAPPGRVRRPGAGRRKLAETDPGLLPALLALVEDSSRGDPESPLLWTTRSVKHLSGELTAQGHACSPQTAWRLLGEQGFSTQSNAQAGREWRPEGDPVQVRDHSFADSGSGTAIPYGIYDVGGNTGFVNVGTDHNTAALAVESIRRWWRLAGQDAYPGATRLLVTCDAGGSNGWKNRGWKAGLAGLARETGLAITVCHFPPGTSKWNKIEHRLFSQITLGWRGRPLTSYDVIINTISAVTTRTGLTVTAMLDASPCPTGTKISDEQVKDPEDRHLTRHQFHGEWNYTVLPAPRPAPPPAPPPAPAGPDLDTLAHPALTGMPRAAFDALAASLELPYAADREQRLHLARGAPRRGWHKGPAAPLKLSLPAYLLAAIYRYRLGMTCQHIAAALGVDHSTISVATRHLAGLLTRQGTTLTPGPHRIRSAQDLRDHAARHGITITGPAATPPDNTVTTPGTPVTHLNLECLQRGSSDPR